MMDSKDEEKIEEISELIESIKTDSESINTADVDEIASCTVNPSSAFAAIFRFTQLVLGR